MSDDSSFTPAVPRASGRGLVEPGRAFASSHSMRAFFDADGARAAHPLSLASVVLFSIVLYSVGSAWGDAIRSVTAHYTTMFPDSRIAVAFVIAIITAFIGIAALLLIYAVIRRAMPYERIAKRGSRSDDSDRNE